MRTSFLMAAVLFLALTTQACQDGSLFPIDPNPKPDPDSGRLTADKIMGLQWQLKSIETIGSPANPVPDGEIYTLNFNDTQSLGGTADCNVYGASYTAGANYSIAIEGYTMTNAYCGDASIDQQYMKALNAATSYYATTETLRIFFEGGKKVLNFAKFTSDTGNEKSSPIMAMPGVEWKLIGIEERTSTTGNGTYWMIGPGEDFSLIISDARTLTGKANCNTYVGSYDVGAGFAFTTSGISATKMSCKLINDFEVTYYGALESAESATIFSQEGQIRLEINYDNGSKILHFEGDPMSPGQTTLSDVIGVRWKLGAIGTDGGGMRAPLTSDPNMIPTITFGANNVLTGTGYCSLFTAHYAEAETTTGNTLSMTDLDWPTTVLCPLDESEYRNTLMSARSYQITGDELFIKSDNNMLMVFMRE